MTWLTEVERVTSEVVPITGYSENYHDIYFPPDPLTCHHQYRPLFMVDSYLDSAGKGYAGFIHGLHCKEVWLNKNHGEVLQWPSPSYSMLDAIYGALLRLAEMHDKGWTRNNVCYESKEVTIACRDETIIRFFTSHYFKWHYAGTGDYDDENNYEHKWLKFEVFTTKIEIVDQAEAQLRKNILKLIASSFKVSFIKFK